MKQCAGTWIAILSGMNLLWACSYVVMKIGLEELDPLALIFWRFAVALLVFFIIIAIKRPSFRLARNDVARIVAAGLVLGASSWLSVVGLDLSHATDASLLYVFEPIWGILLASIILRERVRWTTIAGLVLVLVGLGALSNFDLRAFGIGGGGAGLGNLLVVLGLVCEGFYSVTLKPMARRAPALVTTAGALLVALAVISIPIASRGAPAIPAGPSALFSIAYLSLICTVVGYTLWVHVMKHVPVGVMLFTIFVQPVAGPFIAAAALGEAIDARVITGGAFLIAGMAVAVAGHVRQERRRALAVGDEAISVAGTV